MTDQAAPIPETPFSNATIQAIETIVEEAAYHCRTTCQIALTLEQWRYIAAALKHFSTPAQPAPAADRCPKCGEPRELRGGMGADVYWCDVCDPLPSPAPAEGREKPDKDKPLYYRKAARTLFNDKRKGDWRKDAWQVAQSERAGLSAEEQRDVEFLRNASRGCSSEKEAIQRLLAIIDRRIPGAKP